MTRRFFLQGVLVGCGFSAALLLIVGVCWAADVFRIDKDGSIRLVVTDTGNVGIGTASPQAKLDVQGTVKLGATGAVFTTIKSQEFTWDPPSTADNSASATTLTPSENGVILGVLLPPRPVAASNYCAYNSSMTGATGINLWKDNGNNSIDVAFENNSGGAVDPPAATFVVYYLVP